MAVFTKSEVVGVQKMWRHGTRDMV